MKNVYILDDNESNSNDRYSERKHALLMSESEWLKLGSYLEKGQKLLETAEEKIIKDERRKHLSKEMAKTWDNTVINLRRRRLEQRKERAKNLENDRRRRFLQARQEEEDLKKKVRDEAKATLSLQKDSSKKLTSTLRFSEVLRERAEQIKFESKLKEIEAKRVQDYENSVIADVKKFEEEVKEQKAKEMQKKKQLIIEAQEEFREYFENKRKEQEEKLKLERQDNINILKEIQTEKENAWKEAERKKTLVKEDVRQNRKMIEEYLEQKRLEEEEEDSAIKIHAATKKKIALIRKKKEQEMQNAAQERRNKIAMKLSNDEADRNAKEDAILQKAIEEKEALNEADISNKIAYKERLVNELKKERKAFLDREEQQRLTKKEEAKWNLMQRLKQTEENDKFYKKKLIEKINKMQENRAMWDKQCEERAIAASEEREQDYNAVKRAVQWWEDEDKEFLAYADRVLEDSKKKGRPLLPILKQVEIYKKENNLIRPLPQHEIWKSHIPINSVTKQTQTSNIPEKSKNSQTLIKPIDNTNLNTHDQGKRNIVRKPSLGFKQHTKKPVEPWPKCNEVCILPPKNRNGIQNSQK